MVCVIGFLGNGETVGVGGEKKIHDRVLDVRHRETLTEDNKRGELNFPLSFIL